MATVKVFDANGVKELLCFNTLDEVDYLPVETVCEPESELAEED